MDLINDGIEHRHGFLTPGELASLRSETDFLFSKSTNSGPGFAVHLSPHVQELPWPASKVRSVNLTGKAVQILKMIDDMPGMAERSFHLAHIAVYREHANPEPLLWHSDGRDGDLIRAQVCIRGGAVHSGAFQYIRTSHRLPDVKRLPPPGYVEANSALVQTCAETNGTLYLINTRGFHNKTECTAERISIMFDFLPESYLRAGHGDICSDLVLSINDIMADMIPYLPRLQLALDKDSPSVNTADAYRFQLSWAGLSRRFGIAGRLRSTLRAVRGARS